MIERPFLCMAGEYAATMRAVFRRTNWQHTMSTPKLYANDEELIPTLRRNNFKERIKGIIYYGRTDYDLEVYNLEIIEKNLIPCWPNPGFLLNMSSRHATMRRCVDQNFVHHPVLFCTHDDFTPLSYPYVLKTGENHQGHDKFLIKDESDIIPIFTGIATVEPYFDGESFRVLILDDKVFTYKFFNDKSWIKNSAGADLEMWPDCPEKIKDHAKSVANFFGLEIAGVDYILLKNGDFRFLEINQFPGLGADDEIVAYAQKFFYNKMEMVESWSNKIEDYLFDPITSKV